jgi:hypothetical protein
VHAGCRNANGIFLTIERGDSFWVYSLRVLLDHPLFQTTELLNRSRLREGAPNAHPHVRPDRSDSGGVHSPKLKHLGPPGLARKASYAVQNAQ